MKRKVDEAAKALEKERWNDTLLELKRNPQDVGIYNRYVESVSSEIKEMRSTLEQLQAKLLERVWLRNKDVGDLDERRLIDGLTGDRNVYKRRGDVPPTAHSFQKLPKRITFVFDCSSSMSHYAMDGRMERSLETATMVMESLKGFDHKFSLKFRGHSGSSDDVLFFDEINVPKTDSGRLDVLRAINAHSNTCDSGDNTLEATRLAMEEIVKQPADEYSVFLLSDANLDQYGINPSDLKKLLDADPRVNLFILFIGTMGDQALRLREALPKDRVFITLNTSDIPKVVRKVMTSSMLKSAI